MAGTVVAAGCQRGLSPMAVGGPAAAEAGSLNYPCKKNKKKTGGERSPQIPAPTPPPPPQTPLPISLHVPELMAPPPPSPGAAPTTPHPRLEHLAPPPPPADVPGTSGTEPLHPR